MCHKSLISCYLKTLQRLPEDVAVDLGEVVVVEREVAEAAEPGERPGTQHRDGVVIEAQVGAERQRIEGVTLHHADTVLVQVHLKHRSKLLRPKSRAFSHGLLLMDKIYMQLDLLELLKLIECNITIKYLLILLMNYSGDIDLKFYIIAHWTERKRDLIP